MKRILISMAALLAVVGCAKQEDLVSANFASGPEFGVGIDATRVAIAEDGEAYKLSWTKGDLISVFYNDGGNSQYRFMGETGDVSGKIVAVEAKQGNDLPNFYAVYPYDESNELNGDVLSFTLPAEQSYEKNTFGLGANTMVARTISEGKYDFAFENVCGYICLKVYGGVTVKSIELKGNNNEIISGAATYDMLSNELAITGEGKTITLNCTEAVATGVAQAEATAFWFVVPPTTFEQGFTVTITDIDGNKMTKKGSKSFVVEENTVYNSTFEFKDDNILFDAKFNLDGTATDAGKYNMTIERVVDGEGNTPYMFTVADAASPTGNAVVFNRQWVGPDNAYPDSYYLVNYDANAEFKAALNDGFTMEVVAKKMAHTGGCWMKVFHTNTFGFGFSATQQANKMVAYGCANDNMNSYNMGENIFQYHSDIVVPELEQYYHYMYVYNKEEGKTYLYVDGVKVGEMNDEITSGKRLSIGGYPNEDSMHLPFVGTVAITRLYNNPATDEQVKARYEALNIKKPVTTTTSKPLFDAKFSADGGATNVGSESGLVITPKLGATASTVQRGNTYVATFNNIPKHNGTVTEGYYYIDYAQNESFKNKLKDGFTMEVLSRTTPYAGNMWSKPFAATTFYPHHTQIVGSQWGFAANTPENNWANPGAFGNWFWYDYVTLKAYDHVVLTYDGGGYFSFYVNGQQHGPYFTATAFAPGSAFAIGALPYNNGSAAHPFVGDVAMTRIYDEQYTAAVVAARYNELQPTIKALNEASEEEMELLVDVQFNNDGSATDKANGYTITKETKGEGGNLTVANGIATFGIDDNNLTYYKIDLAQGDGSLKTSMNNGFTIEFIGSAPNNNTVWACPFGGEGFSLVRLAGYGYKWNINGWNTNDTDNWVYTDGTIVPVANQVYHVLYTYDAITGNMLVFRNGALDTKNASFSFAMRENSTMVIGARIDDGIANRPWGGQMATLKVYEQAISAVQATKMYEAVESIVYKANSRDLGLLVDVQFNADASATDKVKGYTITKEVIGEGGTLVVNNGVVTFGDSDDNMSYYKIDLEQGDGALKTSMNNGFTIETIVASPNNNPGWAGAFGGEGFSLLRLHAWGYKWNINMWEPSGTWRYCDGTIAPVANKYDHILYVYHPTTGLAVYRNGVYENNKACAYAMRENKTIVIGARNEDGVVKQSWLGNMASFAIYETPANVTDAEVLYYYAKDKVDALN